ncbi:hypothetical protein H072_7597 [Dactylellina haptotyla CBS 200.50]|uniref:Uncharacterized protein n=1 Tax=Dactylellina haptotyla (strain CBS 200.50) TaxID=1284197 RepID=S8AC35_DACHA|nr:hypothetical protein H072_7597 [Dactylellina haptotyla CBS 200.50]
MLFKLSTVLLLAATALASPLLEQRQVSCPGPTQTTTTAYLATETTTTTLATTTVTNGVSYLGRVTSIKHLTDIRIITTQITIYSPTSVTIPLTTVTATVAGPTTTIVWLVYTSYTTLPGTPPASLCRTTTCTNTIPKTLTTTWTNELWYDTTWLTTVGHVTTTTTVVLRTTTRLVTTPGPTTALTTSTSTWTSLPLAITFSTSWSTVYATPAPTICG